MLPYMSTLCTPSTIQVTKILPAEVHQTMYSTSFTVCADTVDSTNDRNAPSSSRRSSTSIHHKLEASNILAPKAQVQPRDTEQVKNLVSNTNTGGVA